MANYSRLKADNSEDAWDAFFDAMHYPFIADVLEGACKARITGGVSLGELLRESFERG